LLFFFSCTFFSHFSLCPPCLYLFTHRKIKTNYFIVSLAFADLLVSVLVMPFGAIELVQDIWIYGEMFCLVRTSLDVLLTTASIFHLCCISLDR
jgi:5-hydroxytryptamine receptor 4